MNDLRFKAREYGKVPDGQPGSGGSACGRPCGYEDLEVCGLVSEVTTLNSDGLGRTVTVTITAAHDFEGVIRVAMPVKGESPEFFLPGFMYGTNRGDAPLVTDSRSPRLRLEENFPAYPWWMVRSDRLSHPVALAYGDESVCGFAATPYFVQNPAATSIVEAGSAADASICEWTPGVAGDFYAYSGFGCSLKDREVWYTLGYENAPIFFLDSHKYFEKPFTPENCFKLKAGGSVSFTVSCFDYKAADETGIHSALKRVYDIFHESPRKLKTPIETIKEISSAIAGEAWLSDRHCYSGFVFDRGDEHLRPLPSISWTNGLAAAVPMLLSAHCLGDERIRTQALDCIDHIVETSLNPRNNIPFTCEQDGVWGNRGWWYDKQPSPGHAAYLVGQAVYLILKAYEWEKNAGLPHDDWLKYAGKVVDAIEKSKNFDGEYPYIISEKSPAGLDYDSFSGAWCMAATSYYSLITGDERYVSALFKSEKWYYDMYVTRQQCYGGPLDIDKNMDSEGILSYIRAVRCLHELTGEEFLLDHMRDALYYEFTFKFCYNSPIKVPPLGKVGWSSSGGSITSVTNPHIHPMSSSVIGEMMYYLEEREDAYIKSRMEDTKLWSCQCHNTFDGEYGYGKTGWMSERFCHSEGLLTEKYPDGSPASTWFALMPWACGSILEGLAQVCKHDSSF